jgi:hypothetical protein
MPRFRTLIAFALVNTALKVSRSYLEIEMLGFDEAYHLEKNPDVVEVVRRGNWSSGFTHYCITGNAKGRSAVRPVTNAN